ncbi:hypothetical protein [Nocardioides sp.]|nr:hypothetical protein [Nocardioides sp.]
MSGGETVATALTGISLSGADIAALDAYRGALIVSATTTPSSTV